MIELFLSGGVVMWPMAAVAGGVVWIAGRTALRFRGSTGDEEVIDRSLQSLLFWGVIGLTLGVLGTVVGFVIMAEAVGRAGAAGAPLIWGGVSVALVPLLFGLLLFLLAALAWFGLRHWVGGHAGRLGEPVAG